MRTDHGLQVIRIALIGAGRIGTMHAGNIARRVPAAELAAVVDPRTDVAESLAAKYDARAADLDDVLKDPDIDAVAITSVAAVHSELVVRAAEAGKAVFCEKPASLELAEMDRAIRATEKAGVTFQVGFNRRFAADFAAAHDAIVRGEIGTPQLMRSVTRDPGRPGGLGHAASIKPWTIFRETLIHDFDTLLWLNPGAEPVEVYTRADALVAPQYKESGLIDTAAVMLTFGNGAIATAEANFSALYGYDVRGEVFGSKGMVTAGRHASSPVALYGEHGISRPTLRSDEEMFVDAYVAEPRPVRRRDPDRRDSAGHRSRRPQRAAGRAGRDEVPRGAPPGPVARVRMRLAVCAEMVFTDLPFVSRVERIHERGFEVEIWGHPGKDIEALVRTGATFSSMTGYVRGSLTHDQDELLKPPSSRSRWRTGWGVRGSTCMARSWGKAGCPSYRSTS